MPGQLQPLDFICLLATTAVHGWAAHCSFMGCPFLVSVTATQRFDSRAGLVKKTLAFNPALTNLTTYK
jgi:hypothetical protein